MLPYLSLDSLVLGALCAPTLPRWRDRGMVTAACALADYLGTLAANHMDLGATRGAAALVTAAAAALVLVALARGWRKRALSFWLGVAVLFGLDNLMLPVDDGALAAGLGSVVACVIGMAAVRLARRTAQRHWAKV